MEPAESAAFVLGITAVAGAFVGFLVWQLLGTWRARMLVASDQAYRKLAEESIQLQRRTADWMERMEADLADLRQRMAEMDRMLKEVG